MPNGADAPGKVSTSPTTAPPLPVPANGSTSAAGSIGPTGPTAYADSTDSPVNKAVTRAVPVHSTPVRRRDNVVNFSALRPHGKKWSGEGFLAPSPLPR